MKTNQFHRLTALLCALALILTLSPTVFAAPGTLTVETSMLAPATFARSSYITKDGTLYMGYGDTTKKDRKSVV